MKTLRPITSILLSLMLLVCFAGESQAQLNKLRSQFNRAKSQVNRTKSQVNSAKKTVGLDKRTTTQEQPKQEQSSTTGQTRPTQDSNGSVQEESSEGPKHYYVSRNTGRGRIASKEQPAKDLGNIIANLKAGDVIHIAEGVYTSRGDRGSDEINVPVTIIGGYDPTFSTRDPWGAHKTILTGNNHIDGLTTSRLYIRTNQTHRSYEGEIVIDGVIVDNGPRNRYKTDKELLLLRKANPATEKNASPGSAGLKVLTGKYTNVTIRNCVVMNTAPMEGALSVQGNEGSKVLIQNNLVINNTGNGIQCMSAWHPRDGKGLPQFQVLNNTVLFTWLPSAIASNSGNAMTMDTDIELVAAQNVLGFSDRGGVDNIRKCQTITLKDNLITGNKKFDYREWNTKMLIEEIEDESDFISYESTGNLTDKIQVPVSQKWAGLWAGRKEISRADVDASSTAANSDANALRSMLGLPLRGSSVALDAELWLHRLHVEDGLNAGMKAYKGKYGSQDPKLLNL